MVTKLKFPGSLKKVLNYNEAKVKKGMASCILAENFLLDVDKLSFKDKLKRFQDQLDLNEKIETRLVHGFISFDTTEQFSGDKLKEIAKTYMEKIGFGEQPYLVYEHSDSGTSHLHIVSITIKEDGSPIYLHNIGKNQSNTARIEIEKEFNLIKAEGRDTSINQDADHSNLPKVLYGEDATKRQIVNLLDAVLPRYQYTSLEELNAILRLRNVVADRGHVDGRIFKTNGLVYRALDEFGKKQGVGIKASSIYNKPTLAFLEGKFAENNKNRKWNRLPVKNKILGILNQSTAFTEFLSKLSEVKIDVAVRRNEDGFIFGLTYIDHEKKCVFNGSDLAKELTAATVQKKFNAPPKEAVEESVQFPTQKDSKKKEKQEGKSTKPLRRQKRFQFEYPKQQSKSNDELIRQYNLLKQILQSEKEFNQIPFGLTRRKKKKKKKKQN